EDVKACIYCSYWRAADLSTPNGERFAHSLHGLVSTCTGIAQLKRCKECRSHIVLLFPRAGKIPDGSEDPSYQLGGQGELLGVASLLQPFVSEVFFLAAKCILDAIRREERRITCQQSQGQRLVVRRGE